VNDEALPHWGLLRHKKQKKDSERGIPKNSDKILTHCHSVY
jgi:hypothetical protein